MSTVWTLFPSSDVGILILDTFTKPSRKASETHRATTTDPKGHEDQCLPSVYHTLLFGTITAELSSPPTLYILDLIQLSIVPDHPLVPLNQAMIPIPLCLLCRMAPQLPHDTAFSHAALIGQGSYLKPQPWFMLYIAASRPLFS